MNIAFIGDSYTSGYLLTDPSKRWATLLSAAQGATEHNYGVPGAGYVNGGSGGQSTFPQQAALAVGSCADLVIISGGINDAPIAMPGQITASLAQTVATLRAGLPSARIVVFSPMWFHTQPSDQLGTVTTAVETTAPAGAEVIPGASWIRFNRPDLGFYDGHPNECGHALIASWAQEQLYGSPLPAETYGRFIRPGTTDATFSGSGGVNLAEGTIWNARRGWWAVKGSAVLYGQTPGFLYVQAAGVRDTIRADVLASPLPFAHRGRFWHPGGDLHITIGYSPNISTAVVSNGSTSVAGTYLGK